MVRVPIAEARNNLSKLVHDAEHGETIQFTRRGQPVAVMISARDYQRLTQRPRAGLAKVIRELRARYAVEEMDIDADALFPRDRSPGRDVLDED